MKDSSADKVEQLAAKLQTLLNKSPTATLPSIVELAKNFQVPIRLMTSAVHLLREQGILDLRRGAGISKALDKNSLPITSSFLEKKKTSLENLCIKLRKLIAEAVYPEGTPLPKLDSLATEFHISKTTVSRAVNVLLNEGVLWRRGKSLIIGKPNALNQEIKATKPGVILVIHRDMQAIRHGSKWRWLSEFLQCFYIESSKNACSLEYASWRKESSLVAGLISGSLDIKKFAKKKEPKLLGILVVGSAWDPIDNKPWIAAALSEILDTTKCPTLWFDVTDEAGTHYHSGWTHRTYRAIAQKPKAKKNLYRLFLNESLAISLILQSLKTAGHTNIGIANLNTKEKWYSQRKRLLQREINSHYKGLETFERAEFKDFDSLPWGEPLKALRHLIVQYEKSKITHKGLIQLLRELQSLKKAEIKSSHIKRIARVALECGSLVDYHSVSAFICFNDKVTIDMYQWIQLVQSSMGSKIGLISFDNNIQHTYPFAVSSIDFGGKLLAGNAIDIILKRSPSHLGKKRKISSSPFLNHRLTL